MDKKKCTMCGKEFDLWDEQQDFCFERKIQYGSIHDSEQLSINLCCDCFDKVIDIVSPMCKESPLKEV